VLTATKEIWEYNPDNDSWGVKTHFPGSMAGKIISFSYGDKICFGLNHFGYSTGSEWADRKFWVFDLLTGSWSTTEEFPADLLAADTFFFSLNGKLYFGHGRSYFENPIYSLWCYDPSI
jgi:hypothetical protein